MQTFHVIGITDNRELFFPPEITRLIASSQVFSGGKRHHEIVSHLLPPGAVWIDITVPLDAVFAQYTSYPTVVVFASGDPLFFGFANTIMRKLPEANVQVYPAFNSLQLLAHRSLLPYHDMHTISLTGRPWKALDMALVQGEALIGSLTDREKTPITIARRMLDYGYTNYRMVVGECLGNEEEQVREFALDEVEQARFAFPNCIILRQTAPRPRPLGIPESQFELLNGRAKMITKMPIRLLSLSLLDLRHRTTLWDVGFCTGSVSVEAKLQFPHLDIFAFERRPEGAQLMETNSRRFGAPDIHATIGDFMELPLTDYPCPDAVFIGGHGGQLEAMVVKIADRLQAGGVVVFNSVSPESKAAFEEGVHSSGLRLVDTIRLTVDKHNPIDLMKAVKF